MNYLLIAVSHLKRGPEQALFDQYVKRLHRPLQVIEVKQLNMPEREADEIEKHLLSTDWVCVLDERGRDMSSREFAAILEDAQVQWKRQVFIIGGADGLSASIRSRAHMSIRFGKTTWPHLLVRSMLAEQLYRCQQISKNHPYHRD